MQGQQALSGLGIGWPLCRGSKLARLRYSIIGMYIHSIMAGFHRCLRGANAMTRLCKHRAPSKLTLTETEQSRLALHS